MPKHAEYQQIPQDAADEEDLDDEQDVGDVSGPSQRRLPLTTTRPLSGSESSFRKGRSGKIDLTTLDIAFKRWTTEITQRVRRKKKDAAAPTKQDIVFSVFQPVPKTEPGFPFVKTLDDNAVMTYKDFSALTESVKAAILDGIHPKMITKGSSGSYFARSKNGPGRPNVTVGVFKPKDEEYGNLNPKTTKWIHRNFFWWVGWGRACLIPNLSYISEAAASLLDERLSLHIVPRTELVNLSSPAFSYGWMDRNAAKKGKPLPEKIGSFQTFMHGYQDASLFLREHPWPGRAISDTYDESSHRTGGAWKRFSSALGVLCGRVPGVEDEDDDDDHIYDDNEREGHSGQFVWTPALQQEFRAELEKLIILDYLMRNTDRGLDNFMIKYCEGKHERDVINVAPGASSQPVMSEIGTPNPSAFARTIPSRSYTNSPQPGATSSYTDRPHIHLAAIDNSLSFPHQHPKGWRSFVYGWLYLPVSLIGRPFSASTRNHFLPLLSDPAWWSETTYQLRKLHSVDPDFNDRMFQRQMAVMKGQGWNIVQCLKHLDEGPLELTRRTKVMVWDDEVEVPIDATPQELMDCIAASRSKPGATPGGLVTPSIPAALREGYFTPGSASLPNSPPPTRIFLPSKQDRRLRSHSTGGQGEFPPARSPLRRSSSEVTRPVPFSTKTFRGGIAGAATGVSVLEHLEKLDEVENGLNRAVGADEVTEETDLLFEADEEEDVAGSDPPSKPRTSDGDAKQDLLLPSSSPPPQPGSSNHVQIARPSLDVPSRKPGPHPSKPQHSRWLSHGDERRSARSLELSRDLEAQISKSPQTRAMRTVVAERLETVDAKPFFSGW